MLAQGSVTEASRRASEILAQNSRSAAALSLAVEVMIAAGGSAEGLRWYDEWLHGRRLEEPAIVRRLAVAVLHESAAQEEAIVRLEAVKGLIEGGESSPAAALKPSSAAPADLRARAALGDSLAARQLATQLTPGNPEKPRILEALGKSRQSSVIPAVAAQLRDPQDQVRVAAVDALAELRAEQQTGAIRAALDDPSTYVQARAARALFRLGDMSGMPLLQQMATADNASSRLAAAEAMATAPDQSWLALVRSLASTGEPEIRIGAARLLAPHDPEMAKNVLQSLGGDSSIAIRELAARTLAETLTAGDLGTLRRLLTNPDPLTRVRAAAAVLKATF